MRSFAYLLALAVSIASLLILDRRFRLFYWKDARSAVLVSAVSVGALLLTDAVGIAWGLFFRGHGEYLTGILISTELPIEEPVFLWLLVLCAMLAYTGALRFIASRATASTP